MWANILQEGIVGGNKPKTEGKPWRGGCVAGEYRLLESTSKPFRFQESPPQGLENMPRKPSHLMPRPAFTLMELLLVVAILAVLIGLLLPAVQKVRERANQVACQSHLGQIGLGLGQYSLANEGLPAGFQSKVVNGQETGPGWGWATELLPWVDQGVVDQKIDRSVSPLDVKNEPFRKHKIKIYLCSSDPGPEYWDIQLPQPSVQLGAPAEEPWGAFQQSTEMIPSRYIGLCGTTPVDKPGNGLLYRNSRVRPRDIDDGESHTLLVAEKASWVGTAVWHGMLPGVEVQPSTVRAPGLGGAGPHYDGQEHNAERKAHPAAWAISRVDQPLDFQPQPVDGLGASHSAGMNAVFADGHVQIINTKAALAVLQALATRAGGELVDD